MELTQEKIISIIGAVGFHILLIVFLLLYYIYPSSERRWSEMLEGVPVMFGNVTDAYGDDEPSGRGAGGKEEILVSELSNEPASLAEPASIHTNISENIVVTQDVEETVAINETNKAEEARKRQEAIVAETEKKEKAEAERLAALEAQRKQDIDNQMAGLFGNGSGNGSRGNTSGTGTQGVPTGNASYGNTSGIGGWGTYDLGGRGVGAGGLVKPSYNANDYGTVVIDIIVDPQGNVVSADIGRGTNTPSAALKSEALKAARKTKFTAVNTVGNQKGTITYKFNLN